MNVSKTLRLVVIGMMFLTPAWLGAGPAAAAEPQAVTVTIPVGEYQVAKTKSGHEVSVEGFGRLLVPGKPNLPSKIFAVAIPPGAEVVGVTFDTGQGVALPGTYQVSPVPLPRVIGQEDPLVYQQDKKRYDENFESVYGSDDAYPSSVVESVRTAGYRKYNLMDVRVTPFAYRPVSGKLTYYPEITVHVNYKFPDNPRRTIVDNLVRTERIANDIVINHDQAQKWYPQQKSGRGLHDFVIITLDSLTASVTPLVNWETSKGRTVEVVTTTWIAANYTGYDLAEQMRNFLRDKYPSGEWGIEDVLMVGGYDDVPMRRCAQNLGYGEPRTDFYYAELSLPDDQSWDDNENHQWGEDADTIDFYSEVNVGRIPWSGTTTVQNICNKSVAYEQNDDPSFKKNMLLLGAFFWDDDPNPRTDNAVLMETKIDQPWMSDWTFTRMYEQGYSTYPMDYNLTHSNVVTQWSNGTYAFVNWAGHGSATACQVYHTGELFITSADCSQLNDDYPAIIFADACSNSDTDYVNIGQSMLQQGAVGFVGATQVALGCPGWGDPYDGSSQSLDYFFTTCVTSGDYTQGAALQWGLTEMYTNGLWSYNKYETFQWGALWGNPNLSMGYSPNLSISFPDGLPETLPPGVSTDITVQINEGEESYVPGSGTLYYRYDGGTYLTSGWTPLGGNLYEATLPPADCDDTPDYYFSAEGTVSGDVYSPPGAPGDVYTADVGEFAAVFTENLDTNPGWTTQGDWAFGQPTGGGGEYGGPDPTSGHTGNNVYGYNLNGDYPNSLSETHLTSTAIDCTGLEQVHLKFWRWLGVERPLYDHAYIRISNNGSSWTTVWENSQEITDSSWTQVDLDISAVADNQSTVYLRWTMGSTDGGWRYCGWNIDDVQLTAFECLSGETCDDGILNQGEDRIDCGGPCPPCECTADGMCDNGAFCDGEETCDEYGHCQDGTFPCTDPAYPYCDEDQDDCDECADNLHCDDGEFCNGDETCVDGACQDGTFPCTNPDFPYCDEAEDDCDECVENLHCDDELFCNGAETCADGSCQPGDDPCPGQGCDEEGDVCIPLADGDCDGDGDVDLADFVTFQTCFTGPGIPLQPGCECVDFNGDNDVDLEDFLSFQTAYTGPGT